MTQINLLRQVKNLNFPEWFLINWQIVTSVTSWNLAVAIKTLAWADPSVIDPVHCRIGWVVRSITSALSVTRLAWTNWLNLWSAELATKEVDLFVYLRWGTWANTVCLDVSRIPYARVTGDFAQTDLDEKWYIVSSFAWNPATDVEVNIWRFNAILSAWPSYTWSIPATSVIINRPIYETRELSFTPTVTVDNWQTMSWNTSYSTYKIIWNQLIIKYRENWVSLSWTCYTITITKPLQDNFWSWTFVWIWDYYSGDWHKLTQVSNNNVWGNSRLPYWWWALNSWPWSIIDNLNLTI